MTNFRANPPDFFTAFSRKWPLVSLVARLHVKRTASPAAFIVKLIVSLLAAQLVV